MVMILYGNNNSSSNSSSSNMKQEAEQCTIITSTTNTSSSSRNRTVIFQAVTTSLSNNGCGCSIRREFEIEFLYSFVAKSLILAIFGERQKYLRKLGEIHNEITIAYSSIVLGNINHVFSNIVVPTVSFRLSYRSVLYCIVIPNRTIPIILSFLLESDLLMCSGV